jgi:hypothetical protein
METSERERLGNIQTKLRDRREEQEDLEAQSTLWIVARGQQATQIEISNVMEARKVKPSKGTM